MADDIPPLPKGAVPIGDDSLPPLPKGAAPIEQPPTGIAGYPRAVAENFRSGQELAKSGLQGPWYQAPTNVAKVLGGGVQELASPLTGAVDAFVANPIKRTIPGPVGEFAGNVTGDALSLVGGGGAVKGLQEVGKGVSKIGQVASRLKPGAMKEASEAVSAIGETSDVSVLGSKMHRDLTGKINKLVKERRETASKLKADYFSEGIAKEKEVADAYRNDLTSTLKTHARDLSPEQKKLVQDSIDHLGKDPSIEAIETERRRLSDIASGATEGYDAIQKLFAGSMARNLRAQLTKAIPAADKFFSAYAEMSEPINMFEDTALGKRVTKGASDFLPDVPYYNPSDLPKAFFKDKYTMGVLKKLVGGDEKMVSDAASEYTASALKDLSAKDARAWVNKNKIWLDEVPDVQVEAERYVKNLEDVTHTQERAGKAVKYGVLGGIAAEGYRRLSHIMGF